MAEEFLDGSPRSEAAPRPGPGFWVLFTFLAVLCVAPVFRREFLPAVDYPQHISTVRFLRLAFEDPAAFHATFGTRLLQPYWGFYLPALLFSAVMPVDLAGKVCVAVILLLIPLALLVLGRQEGLDARISLLGFPLIYSFSFFWGFFPFLAGAVCGLLGLVPVLKFARTKSSRALLGLHVASLVVFLAHATAWGFWIGWAGWILVTARPRLAIRDLLRAGSAFLLPAVLFVAWSSSVETSGTLRWMREYPFNEGLDVRLRELPHNAFLTISPAAEAALFSLFVAALLVLGLGRYEAGARARTVRWLGLAALMGLAYFVVPHQFLGLNYTYQRTLVFALFFAILASARELRFPRAVLLAGVGLSLATAILADESSRRFNEEMAGLKSCLMKAAPRSTLMGLIPERRLPELRLALFLHTSSYHAYFNLGRVYTHSMETLPTPPIYFRDRTLFQGPRPVFESLPFSFEYPAEAKNVRYFLIRARLFTLTETGPKQTDELLLKGGLARSRLVCDNGLWRLYENLDLMSPNPPEGSR
jgi:hypothetical protein